MKVDEFVENFIIINLNVIVMNLLRLIKTVFFLNKDELINHPI
jgi:hypothetical protein